MTTDEEKKPILTESGVYIKGGGLGGSQQPNLLPTNGQQHLIIQPIEFDTKHRNLYGYLSLGVFILVLANYLMIKERACQFSLANDGIVSYDLIQSFHLTVVIVAIIVFILSYFNFAVVIYEFKLLFFSSAALILICTILLTYDAIAIVSAPCTPITSFSDGLIQAFGAGSGNNIFTAHDGIGITVFLFDLVAAAMMLFAGYSFYKR